jgi:hypothetical protein
MFHNQYETNFTSKSLSQYDPYKFKINANYRAGIWHAMHCRKFCDSLK